MQRGERVTRPRCAMLVRAHHQWIGDVAQLQPVEPVDRAEAQEVHAWAHWALNGGELLRREDHLLLGARRRPALLHVLAHVFLGNHISGVIADDDAVGHELSIRLAVQLDLLPGARPRRGEASKEHHAKPRALPTARGPWWLQLPVQLPGGAHVVRCTTLNERVHVIGVLRCVQHLSAERERRVFQVDALSFLCDGALEGSGIKRLHAVCCVPCLRARQRHDLDGEALLDNVVEASAQELHRVLAAARRVGVIREDDHYLVAARGAAVGEVFLRHPQRSHERLTGRGASAHGVPRAVLPLEFGGGREGVDHAHECCVRLLERLGHAHIL
mmetsp:Transcript_2438/g.9700  ORF Transcript_2438/g.9700 Transcript_2438/m.9700 type:complete len:329 (-) Transcript_2438:308-1294(-)